MKHEKCPFCKKSRKSAGVTFVMDEEKKVWIEVKPVEDSLPDQSQEQSDLEKSD